MLSLRPGRVIAGKYRLDHELARGGMGSLWVAFDRRLRRKVAIKFIINAGSAQIEEASLRFEREARAVAQIRSPHVVQTHDYGMDRGHAYMVMELLEGEDLGARLMRERRLRLTTVAKLLRQIAKGLDAVHAAGIVHRDLKPANVFLASVAGEETVKLIDFGVALADDGDSPRTTRQGAILGTVKYMAPEQALGETTVDHRADLWSLAVIVYRLLTGKYPFQGDTMVELVLSVCQDPITPPSKYVANLPAGIDTFFERAFARAPGARFHSAHQLASSFTAAIAATRTGTLPWGTIAPRASAPSAIPDARNILESELDDEASDEADRLCASRESLEETLMHPNALPPVRGILPSSYTPSPSLRGGRGPSRKRWWWASIPAALVVVGAVVVSITAGGPRVSPIGPRAAPSASDASPAAAAAAPAR